MDLREPVKLGIVGLGRWAKVLTSAAQKSNKLSIIAGHSRSQEKRDSFNEKFGIKTYGSLQEILDNDEIKGVIITVPNEQHYTVAKQIAEAGKHIIPKNLYRIYWKMAFAWKRFSNSTM